jgi:hypothetical protein
MKKMKAALLVKDGTQRAFRGTYKEAAGWKLDLKLFFVSVFVIDNSDIRVDDVDSKVRVLGYLRTRFGTGTDTDPAVKIPALRV